MKLPLDVLFQSVFPFLHGFELFSFSSVTKSFCEIIRKNRNEIAFPRLQSDFGIKTHASASLFESYDVYAQLFANSDNNVVRMSTSRTSCEHMQCSPFLLSQSHPSIAAHTQSPFEFFEMSPPPENRRRPVLLVTCVVGASSVGKTSFLRRLHDWPEHTPDFTACAVYQGVTLKLQQLCVPSSRPGLRLMFKDWEKPVRMSHVIYLMFDVGERASFDALPNLLRSIERVNMQANPVILVGNKVGTLSDFIFLAVKTIKYYIRLTCVLWAQQSCPPRRHVHLRGVTPTLHATLKRVSMVCPFTPFISAPRRFLLPNSQHQSRFGVFRGGARSLADTAASSRRMC